MPSKLNKFQVVVHKVAIKDVMLKFHNSISLRYILEDFSSLVTACQQNAMPRV